MCSTWLFCYICGNNNTMSATAKIELTMASISSRITALKTALNGGQTAIYENKIKELKEAYLKNNPNLTEEEIKMVNNLFR